MSDKTASTNTWDVDAKYPVTGKDKAAAQDPTKDKTEKEAPTGQTAEGSRGGGLETRNIGPIANVGPTIGGDTSAGQS